MFGLNIWWNLNILRDYEVESEDVEPIVKVLPERAVADLFLLRNLRQDPGRW